MSICFTDPNEKPQLAQWNIFPNPSGHSQSASPHLVPYPPLQFTIQYLCEFFFFFLETILCPHLTLWAYMILPWPLGDLCVACDVNSDPSAGWGGHLVVVGTFKESWVTSTHLERGLTRDVGGTSAAWPGLRVQELAGVVGAVAEARAVETGMARLVDLLRRVALHEQVHRHDACTLQCREDYQGELKSTWQIERKLLYNEKHFHINNKKTLQTPKGRPHCHETETEIRKALKCVIKMNQTGAVFWSLDNRPNFSQPWAILLNAPLKEWALCSHPFIPEWKSNFYSE